MILKTKSYQFNVNVLCGWEIHPARTLLRDLPLTFGVDGRPLNADVVGHEKIMENWTAPPRYAVIFVLNEVGRMPETIPIQTFVTYEGAVKLINAVWEAFKRGDKVYEVK